MQPAPLLTMALGIATAEAIAQACGIVCDLRWPNDLMLDNRKVAGILCEARWSADRLSWVTVGIGINVRGPLPSEIAAHAIALAEVVGGATRVAVLEALVPHLHGLSDEPGLSIR